MALILLIFLIVPSPLATAQSPAGRPSNAALSTRIKRLLHTSFTSDEESNDAEEVEVKQILARNGLPTIREVGDEAAYDFVVLLASDHLMLELGSRILPTIRAAVANQDLPPDAGTFYE